MKRLLLFTLVATLFAACSKGGVNELSNDRSHAIPDMLYASIDTEDATRVQLNELQKTVWTEGDRLSVFYFSNGNTPFEFNGKTGDREGGFRATSLVEGSTDVDKIVSIYPYSETYTMNTDNKYVSVKLPATQHYLEDSYGVGDNLIAYVGKDGTNLSHKNLCGWIKIQLTGSDTITKITLRGNDGEQLAGDVKFYYEDFRLEPLPQGGLIIGEYIETITLDCGNGVTLDAETPTDFYFVVAPQTFDGGFTVDIEAADGTIMTKSTTKTVTIERNHIQPMTAFAYTPSTPANNEIWYTATAKVEPYNTDEFGAKYLSNVWDSETGIGVITFEGDVTKIGYYAFYGYQTDCNKLTSVTIPNSVTTIGESAFYSCDSLTSVTIGNSVTTIGDLAFYYCTSLTSVTIPDSVTTIESSAFRECASLTSVTIGDSVTTIGSYAFSKCTSLKEFKGKFAADGGSCLIMDNTIIAYAEASGTTYTIPDSVTTIGYAAFSGCSSLTSVTIPDSVTTIGDWAFEGCTSLTSVTIPDSVTTIESSAFRECASLTSVTIPDSVTTIESSAFRECASLTSVTISDNVTTIGDLAFYYCTSLTSVTIPDSVTTIGEYAFENCTSLKTVYCKPTTPPTGDRYMFDNNAAGRRIFVPASDDDSIIKAYKARLYWSNYANYIFEEE